jgi:LysM repeat protein
MKTESVTVHKGGQEEKYKIYVEDYVISYLKFEADTLELSEIFFYGHYEKETNQIVIYGAGRDRQLAVFEKYELLEKVACRLTQAGPVFMIRENGELYEAQGYDIFYHENKEMQNYMIACKRRGEADEPARRSAGGHDAAHAQKAKTGALPEEDQELHFDRAESAGSHLHYTLTLQLGVIFVILVAIVISSTNSYDRMEQINQSAKEVLFALENQEAEQPENTEAADEAQLLGAAGDKEVTRAEWVSDSFGEDENVTRVSDNETDTGQEQGNIDDTSELENDESASDAGQSPETAETLSGAETLSQTGTDETQQSTEALSRNVTRYYEIERGDTLYAICEEIYGDTSKVQQICDLNQIADPDDIRYGQKIILP